MKLGLIIFSTLRKYVLTGLMQIEVKTSSVSSNKVAAELTLGHADSESKYDIGLVLKNDKWLMNSVNVISRNTGHCNEN
jgi:hypothetical protein